MIVSCVAALAAFIGSLASEQDAISYEVKHCTLDMATKRSWVDMTWKFNENRFSGTSGRTTVNHFLQGNCSLPRGSELIYVNDLSQPYSTGEYVWVTRYKLYLDNALRFFMADFCYRNVKKS